mmetsp:Transcript_39913/g.61083  ORF Transcript_39913/g.61083 Transcript_39913/m.61083 type:complete len:88 (+) Transcript_39913:778-1041(+)
MEQKVPCPKINEAILGVGIATGSCKYDQSFFGSADKYKNKLDSDVFNAWRTKLKRHEERQQVVASQMYRQHKRVLAKQAIQALKQSQ